MAAAPRHLELPIDAHRDAIVGVVRSGRNLVLVAEPGAGKTTRVPRFFLEAGLAGSREIVVLEPRRIAARWSAARVAEELGESLGERVGFQVRFEEASSARTRLRFVTEGIVTRWLVADPSLSRAAIVVLDEFHERHLHGDVALALLRRAQRDGRPDLRIVVMSATLDHDALARHLDADVLHVPGRTFPVEVRHASSVDARPLEAQIAAAARDAASDPDHGDVLVFLPGAAEIRRAMRECEQSLTLRGFEKLPLHGDLAPAEQDRVARLGTSPRLIFATNVAETSITLPRVTHVIDSGLARIAAHSAFSGLPTLNVEKISRASAIQRAGRAGRVREGRALRLYTKHDFDTRPAFTPPEVVRLDLSETLLALGVAGVRSPASLDWLDAPPDVSVRAATKLLVALGAFDDSGVVTPLGRELATLPLHPRLARMLVEARRRGVAGRGAWLAAVASERDPRPARRAAFGANSRVTEDVGACDWLARVEAIEAATALSTSAGALRDAGLDVGAATAILRTRERIERWLGRDAGDHTEDEQAVLAAVAVAFPDRIAQRRAKGSPDVVFADGGSARLAEESVVQEAELLVALEAEERRGGSPVIRAASEVTQELLLELFPERLESRSDVLLEPRSGRPGRRTASMFGALVLDERWTFDLDDEARAEWLTSEAEARGWRSVLDWDEVESLRARIALLRAKGHELAELDDARLRAVVQDALRSGVRSLEALREVAIAEFDAASRPPKEARALRELVPRRLSLPGGRVVSVIYEAGKPPWIASRLQDFFGSREGPRVLGEPIVLHLLAPNQRAVQVTTDLAGFWERHYPAIRKELMRRYPRHAWPEDPRTAAPPAPRSR